MSPFLQDSIIPLQLIYRDFIYFLPVMHIDSNDRFRLVLPSPYINSSYKI